MFVRHSANNQGTGIYFGKSRNAAVGSNTVVQDDDELGRITFSGDDGTDINTMSARIQCHVDGTPGSNDMPGRLTFSTTADGASTVTERLRITSGGEIGINVTPSNGQMLAITGRSGYDDIVQVTAVGTNMGARINLTNTGTGVSRINATNNSLNLQTGGTSRLEIASDGKVGVNLTPETGGGLVQIRYNEAYTSGTTNLATSASKAALRIRTSSDSSKSLYFGGIDEAATPYLQVGNRADSGATTSYPLVLQPYGSPVVVGTTADVAPDGFSSLVQVNSANHTGSITIGRHTANANGPVLLFNKTRSGTAAPGNGAVSDDDTLGVIRWYGSDGTDYNSSAAEISCHVDTTPGTNDMPGRIQMGTTPDGESSPKESFRLDRTNSITGGAGGITHTAMDNLTTGYAHMPSWTQGSNNLAGDVWTTVLNVGTSEATWDLVSFEGSTNSGLWCEITCYFSQITAGKAGRQRVSYRIMRTGNSNFGTSVDGPYDKVGTDTSDHFTPSITTTGSGSGMRAKFRVTTASLVNYCMTIYHIRWVAGDYMVSPYIIV